MFTYTNMYNRQSFIKKIMLNQNMLNCLNLGIEIMYVHEYILINKIFMRIISSYYQIHLYQYVRNDF